MNVLLPPASPEPDPDEDNDPLVNTDLLTPEVLESLAERYASPSFVDELFPVVVAQCARCDEETCWRCPRCEHYLCSGCATWLDELEKPPEGDYDEEEDVVLCCDECNARLEMMVR